MLIRLYYRLKKMQQRIRTFIGIPLPGLEGLVEWQDELKQKLNGEKVKWNEKHLWHLTLKFIGDLEPQKVQSLCFALGNEFSGSSQGQLIVKGAGIFGQIRNPKVVWAGIEDSSWLQNIWHQTQAGVIASLDMERDGKPFRPHLTIGRVKYLKNTKALFDEVKAVKENRWGIVQVRYVVLYKSRLTTNGPIYSEIERFPLGYGV
nr:RNA 2',3'-cyclic phosphodiesterase [Thermophagus xiamenensis]